MKLNVKDLLNKTYRFFKSLKLTAIVIASLIVIYFLGLVLPQKWMFDSDKEFYLWIDRNIINQFLHFIGFTDIYMSPVTLTFLAFFFIILLTVTLNRVPVMLKRAFLMGELPSFGAAELKRGKKVAVIAPEMERTGLDERLMNFFKKKRWFFKAGGGKGIWIAVKNRLSPIGFLLFHFSFFLCLIGGLMIAYTRFSGNLPLTEGQKFEGKINQFRTIDSNPKVFKKLPPFQLYIEKVQPSYENNIPTELVVLLEVKYGDDIKQEVLRVNEPLHRGAMSIIVKNIGVSPLFIFKEPSGREIDGAYVSLNVLSGKEDSFVFDSISGYEFYVKFYPDFIVENGIAKTRSVELNNPAVHLIVEKYGGKIYEGIIKKGEPVALDFFTLSFEDIRYWVEFIIVREYGKIPLIAGFIFAGIGLIMRLVFYQKRVRLAIDYESDKPLLYIDGRSEYFKYSFEDELETLVNDLEDFLRKKD